MLSRLLIALAFFLAAGPAAAQTVVVHAGRLITDASKPAMGQATIREKVDYVMIRGRTVE